MFKENNLSFLDKEMIDNKSDIDSIDFTNNQFFDVPFFFKSDFLPPLHINNFNLNNYGNMSCEQFENIMKTKTIDLDEENSKDSYCQKDKTLIIDLHSTDDNNTKNTSLSKEKFITKKNYIDSNKEILFKTVLLHKRGRKQILENKIKKEKKIHYSDDFDNIQRKIQVHFINFLINLANDALKTVFGKKIKFQFKDVKYKLKKIVNHNYSENLKKIRYRDILQMDISPKNRNFGPDNNRIILEEVCENSLELKELFDKNYLYIFQKYYYKNKNNNNLLDLDGFKINLSPKTKTFSDLLKKNEVNVEKFNNISKNIYFSGLNYNEKKNM